MPGGLDEVDDDDDSWELDDDERDDGEEEELLETGKVWEGVGSGRRLGDGRRGVGYEMKAEPAAHGEGASSSGDCIVMSSALLEGLDD